MTRTMLIACLPWLALLVASVLLLYLLARASRARLELGRLRRLHADEFGAVESLSFVLTLPLFIWVLMFIVQVSQLMIGQIVVEYAAIAAARAAAVWLPARVVDSDGFVESWNCCRGYDWNNPLNVDPSPQIPFTGPQPGGKIHVFDYDTGQPGDYNDVNKSKYKRIRMAAALACLSISPSRSLPGVSSQPAPKVVDALAGAYAAMTGKCDDMEKTRLSNKLAYTLFQVNPYQQAGPTEDTLTVNVEFYHSNEEFPLAVPMPFLPGQVVAGVYPDLYEYVQEQELGWQDAITVRVRYNLALLPGPGRLLATWQGKTPPIAGITAGTGQADKVASEKATKTANVYTDVYTYALTAVATMGMEGEKPAYAHYNLPPYQ